MKQNILLIPAVVVVAALSVTGCQSGSNTDAENEALRRQISQLEQQVNDLKQQVSSGEAQTAPEDLPAAAEGSKETAPAGNPETQTEVPAAGSTSTTYTLEELTDMVTAYEEKASAAAPAGSAEKDMEQFLTLKQEEKKIDDELDRHEDELEFLYRNGSLSRDDYKAQERELERLEDRLDAAEDTLEYIFGIDD